MSRVRFLRLTEAGGTVYNAGDVAEFSEHAARALLRAGHAMHHAAESTISEAHDAEGEGPASVAPEASSAVEPASSAAAEAPHED